MLVMWAAAGMDTCECVHGCLEGEGKQFTPPSPIPIPPHVAPFSVGISFVDGHIINPDVELIATAEPVSNIHVCAGCRALWKEEIKRHNDP